MMVHEKQIRQLCGIHAVNNLLQLPSNLAVEYFSENCDQHQGPGGQGKVGTDERRKRASTMHEWTCRGRTIKRCSKTAYGGGKLSADSASSVENSVKGRKRRSNGNIRWRIATQREFDDIADEFTLREQMLMGGDQSTLSSIVSGKEEAKTSGMKPDTHYKLSTLQRLRSQYGTPYFGNYSLEVIEEALKRRGVEIEFYRVTNDTFEPYNENESSGNSGGNTSPPSIKCLVGFIIYEKEENQRSALSFISRTGGYIPIVKHLCGVGKHWYTITGVRYHQCESQSVTDDHADAFSNNNDCNHLSWSLIDSKATSILTLETGTALMDYLREVQQGGGLIFRAFAAVDNELESNNSI